MRKFISGLALATVLGAVPVFAQDPFYVIISNPDTDSPYPFKYVDTGSALDRSSAEDLAAQYRACTNLVTVYAEPYQAWYHQINAGLIDPIGSGKIPCTIN